MDYPTIEQVKVADRIQLATWHRFLPSPGWHYADKENFSEMIEKEIIIANLIHDRFQELGGMNSNISKLIGW